MNLLGKLTISSYQNSSRAQAERSIFI